MLTKQEIFNIVKTHLLTQKNKSIANEQGKPCAYRGANGMKCAVGALITDEAYDKYNIQAYNSSAVGSDAIRRALADSGVDLSITDIMGFLRDLQMIHDHNSVSFWEKELKLVALCHGLDF